MDEAISAYLTAHCEGLDVLVEVDGRVAGAFVWNGLAHERREIIKQMLYERLSRSDLTQASQLRHIRLQSYLYMGRYELLPH